MSKSKKKKGQPKRGGTMTTDELPDASAEIAQTVRDQMDALGDAGGVRAQILRLRRGERDKYLDQVDAGVLADNPAGYIKERWGGGRFKIGLRDSKAKWIKGASAMTLEIEGQPIMEELKSDEARKLEELEKRVEGALKKSDRGDISTAELFRLQMELTQAQLKDLRNPPDAAYGANIPEMIVSIMTAIQSSQQPLLQALIERGTKEPERADPMGQIEQLAKVASIFKDLFGDNRSENARGWDRVVDRLADPLAGLVDQHLKHQATGAAPPGPPAAHPNPPKGAPMDPVMTFVGRLVPELVSYASAGKDPEIIADFVAETRIPDAALGPVYEALNDPAFLPRLHETYPATRPHARWIQAFADRILQHVDVLEPEEPEDARGESDAVHSESRHLDDVRGIDVTPPAAANNAAVHPELVDSPSVAEVDRDE